MLYASLKGINTADALNVLSLFGMVQPESLINSCGIFLVDTFIWVIIYLNMHAGFLHLLLLSITHLEIRDFLVRNGNNILDELSVVATVSRTGSISFAHLRSIWVSYKCDTSCNVIGRGSDGSHVIQ
jgi:hypothetical protein